MLLSSEQKILIKSFLTGVLYECLKIIHACLNEGDKGRECYSYSLHVGFFTIFFIKRASLKLFVGDSYLTLCSA